MRKKLFALMAICAMLAAMLVPTTASASNPTAKTPELEGVYVKYGASGYEAYGWDVWSIQLDVYLYYSVDGSSYSQVDSFTKYPNGSYNYWRTSDDSLPGYYKTLAKMTTYDSDWCPHTYTDWSDPVEISYESLVTTLELVGEHDPLVSWTAVFESTSPQCIGIDLQIMVWDNAAPECGPDDWILVEEESHSQSYDRTGASYGNSYYPEIAAGCPCAVKTKTTATYHYSSGLSVVIEHVKTDGNSGTTNRRLV